MEDKPPCLVKQNHTNLTTAIKKVSTHQTVSGVHGNSTDNSLSDVLGHLKNQTGLAFLYFHFQSVQHTGQLIIELYTSSPIANNRLDNSH